MAHCEDVPCEDRSQQIGVVVYAGGYDPTTLAPSEYGDSYYQNFTVTAPAMATGPAVLSVVHTELIGVSLPSPLYLAFAL